MTSISNSSNINHEPEDLFADEREHSDETMEERGGRGKFSKDAKTSVAITGLADMAMANDASSKDDNDDDDGYEDDEEEGNRKEGDFKIPQRFTKSGRKRATPFPLKLMKVLSTKEFEEIIAWMPSGKSFNILKPKAFVASILPTHFKSAKYSSFTRKLHRWGFMRHYRGDEAGAFFHKDFQKGRLDLVEKMTCHKTDFPKTSSAPIRKDEFAAAPAASRTQPQAVNRKSPMVPQVKRQMNMVPNIPASLSLSPHQVGRVHVDPHASADLDVAIEMEVSRRLKERINAAALSRQALVMMQQQQQLQQQQLKPPGMIPMSDPRFFHWGAAPARSSAFMGQAALMHAPLVMGNQGFGAPMYGKFDVNLAHYNQFGVAPDMGGPFHSLPSADIQGAKTA